MIAASFSRSALLLDRMYLYSTQAMSGILFVEGDLLQHPRCTFDSITDALLTASELLHCKINLTDALLDRIDVVHGVAV